MTMCLALANVERDADVWIECAPAIRLKIRGGVEHEPVSTRLRCRPPTRSTGRHHQYGRQQRSSIPRAGQPLQCDWHTRGRAAAGGVEHVRRDSVHGEPRPYDGAGASNAARRPRIILPVASDNVPLSKITRPRRIVVCTTPRRDRPAYGVIGWRWCRADGSTRCSASGSQITRSASWPTAIAALDLIEPGERCRRRTHPARDPIERDAPRRRTRPDGCQAELQRGDAAPRRHEVTRLERRWSG